MDPYLIQLAADVLNLRGQRGRGARRMRRIVVLAAATLGLAALVVIAAVLLNRAGVID